MACEWMDKYKTGDKQMDAEHQEWFRLANRFLMADAGQPLLESGQAFSRYTRHHFIQEEALMRQAQFPFTDTHAREHDLLVGTLEKILEVVDQNVLSKDELESFVGYCLARHIATFDAPFSVFVRRNGVAQLA